MAIPNTSYDELTTVTLDNYRKKLADNVMNHNPLLFRLNKKGNTDPADGGKKILENLMYGENSTAKWYSGYEILDVSDSDVLTSADFDWKQFNVNVTYNGLEEIQNAGAEQIKSLVKSRIKVAEITAKNKVAAALFNSNTEDDGKAIGGLQHLVSKTPTSGTVGGIDASTNAWWRNQVYDFSDESVTASASTIVTAMNKTMINCTRGGDTPDMAVADNNYFEFYLNSLQDQQRFMSDDTAGAGFRAIKFWGGSVDVFFDSNCPANTMYMLNTDYLHFRPSKKRNFTTKKQRVSINQDATVVPIFWAGNKTTSNRNLQGVITA